MFWKKRLATGRSIDSTPSSALIGRGDLARSFSFSLGFASLCVFVNVSTGLSVAVNSIQRPAMTPFGRP